MTTLRLVATLCAFFVTATATAEDQKRVGHPFYGDPPDTTHPWAVHDWNRPQPPIVTPGTFSSVEQPGRPPSDAIVLFDGSEAALANWEADKDGSLPTTWIAKDGALQCVPDKGGIRTRREFGDVQLHVEWAAPAEVKGDSQGRGNSGIFLLGCVEVQVLDNYNNPSYADGMAGALYGITPPMANALRPPGQFQVVDIVFRRPVYRDGKPLDPGYVTVFINGVLVQDHTPLEGRCGHMGRPRPSPLPDQGKLHFQDHGNAVRYRNVWLRPLPPRAVEGGTDGQLSPEATLAKRAEIAATIRADAATLRKAQDPLPEMLRLLESLYYERNEAAFTRASALADGYAATISALSGDPLARRKDEVKRVHGALKYLARFNIIGNDYAAKTALESIIKAQRWDK